MKRGRSSQIVFLRKKLQNVFLMSNINTFDLSDVDVRYHRCHLIIAEHTCNSSKTFLLEISLFIRFHNFHPFFICGQMYIWFILLISHCFIFLHLFYDNQHRKVVLPIRSSVDLVLDFTQDSRWSGYCTGKQK